ncbi:MAG: NAD(P)H-dependent oxidoreductase [Gammaproteobacteria bacterium]
MPNTTASRPNAATGDAAVLRLLRVDASARYGDSVSRRLLDRFEEQLRGHHGRVETTVRDVARGLPFVDADWVAANFTAPDQRSETQRARLAQSDALVAELQAADVVVIGVPVYNFSIPASLKAWVDLVARAGLTFRYTSDGPEGLLKAKKAYLVVASGGVAVGSEADFASRYLRHMLGFLGITDVEVIGADQLALDAEAAVAGAETRISEQVRSLVETCPTEAA